MDPVGLALGVVSLAGSISGSFVSIVQCFEYVQLGRSFEKDFNRSQARLGALKLRLTRLGVVLGLLPDPLTGQPREFATSKENAVQAEELVDSLLQDVKDIEKKSKRYLRAKKSPTVNGEALAVYDINELDEPSQVLSRKTGDIVSKRLKGISCMTKAKWALYEKRHFDSLLADITNTLDILESIFPNIMEAQRALCNAEVKELENDAQGAPALQLLREACEEDSDTALLLAVRDAITARGSGHRYEWTEIHGRSIIKQGDFIARDFYGKTPLGRLGHNFGTLIIKGESKLRQGDTYGNGEIF